LLKQKIRELQGLSYGSVFDTITTKTFDGLDVYLPPLPEQTQIANILSAIDDKIENNLAINKTLEDMAMALYKHWFVDFGPFREGEFIDSELGLIPKGWEVKSVKDFGETITGKTPSKKFPEHFGKDMPFVTPTDFKNYGKHILNANRSISKLGIEKHKRNVIPANSIIVTCIGSDMGKVAISKTSCLTNQQINSLKCKNYHFMFCFFVHNYSLLKSLAGDGTTMPIINKSTFESIEVLYPGNENLNSFEKIIKEYDKQILNNTQENQSLTNLRDNLLPKLISGEVRLKEFREGIDAEMNSA
jgi:type I restriction enzyme S subunit